MKKKIKLLAIATTLCLSYLFTACGDNNSTSATTSSTEATTPTKENTGVIGYWQTTDEQIPSYYHISDDKMEFIAMGIKMSLDLVITDNTLTASLFGEESTIAYETAEIATRKMGVRVYNATRGGKLEAFERVDLLQVLNK